MTALSASTDAPRVSVVIPCYNLGQYVDEAVDSVLGQTYGNFEIIIVNDGSTDPDTNHLLANYQRPRTTVITTANRGLAAARNVGIAHARGDFICALDADDKLDSTHFEKTVRVLDDNPSVAFASCWLRTFGDEDWVWRQERCDLLTLLGECTVCTASLVRRSAVNLVGGFDESMPTPGYEDWDLWISLVARGLQGVIVPEVLFYYRRRVGSMSERCCYGQPHLSLMAYMFEKHRVSYEGRLVEVLLGRDAELLRRAADNCALASHLELELRPAVLRRREDLMRMEMKLRQLGCDRS